MKLLKGLTILVGVIIAGEVFALGGTIYTAVKTHRSEVPVAPSSIPTPAGIPVPAGANPAAPH